MIRCKHRIIAGNNRARTAANESSVKALLVHLDPELINIFVKLMSQMTRL